MSVLIKNSNFALAIINRGHEKEKCHKDTSDLNEITAILEVVDWANSDTLTEEEAQRFDSLNENNSLLIRNAERELDTIVNHYHFIFITDD